MKMQRPKAHGNPETTACWRRGVAVGVGLLGGWVFRSFLGARRSFAPTFWCWCAAELTVLVATLNPRPSSRHSEPTQWVKNPISEGASMRHSLTRFFAASGSE